VWFTTLVSAIEWIVLDYTFVSKARCILFVIMGYLAGISPLYDVQQSMQPVIELLKPNTIGKWTTWIVVQLLWMGFVAAIVAGNLTTFTKEQLDVCVHLLVLASAICVGFAFLYFGAYFVFTKVWKHKTDMTHGVSAAEAAGFQTVVAHSWMTFLSIKEKGISVQQLQHAMQEAGKPLRIEFMSPHGYVSLADGNPEHGTVVLEGGRYMLCDKPHETYCEIEPTSITLAGLTG